MASTTGKELRHSLRSKSRRGETRHYRCIARFRTFVGKNSQVAIFATIRRNSPEISKAISREQDRGFESRSLRQPVSRIGRENSSREKRPNILQVSACKSAKAALRELTLLFWPSSSVQSKCSPPLRSRISPVINPDMGETRKATQWANSSGSQKRPTGIC